ncbi:chorismate-binding protein [Staphylococcus pseudintermedius]|uniref:chorismate-binding protein n=1 Tax=Staphylococcus pseudintermedius TaxID=283734 RepID=UPI0008093821|nr:anthranilate synthase component I family protein [Staphylococcus pseudintermedius]ANS90423.1 Para-aminobenzoate synthase, aminase component [Staphylococcus pseudintermedius]EGQ1291294.1 aminodeoxychorismate synthase component I [Staphylococcus pseudintermedius]EGQ1609559.1 anthranilate synthase component I family protein [Staphylococcus pseudintermedius]EGQ1698550.1 anthranilate synthase component I family protein [Staphylococcus pseudintermedius]EGQ1718016.1 anthranilate synthase component
MVVKFNYKYYNDPNTTTTYQYHFDQPLHQGVARELKKVGQIIEAATQYQQQGYYVALYLPYEAAPYFHEDFQTYTPDNGIYAAYYAFDAPVDAIQATTAERSQRRQGGQFQFMDDKHTITKHIRTIHDEITAGWTYQVNYTTRLKSFDQMSISALYDQLTQHTNGDYTVLIDTTEVKLASISPELFFQVGDFGNQGRTVVSKPMKGTMPRGTTVEEDERNAQALRQSEKDRAENVMIVDLLRNDIARVAKRGSVKVYHPFAIERYQTVFQMTTMVTGQITDTATYETLLHALFPCGSITGAPKVNTMRIIHRLETTPRHIYCGAIGLLHPNGRAIFNVPIRTVEQINDTLYYGVGAGITIDSNPEQEYAEFHAKMKILEGLQ